MEVKRETAAVQSQDSSWRELEKSLFLESYRCVVHLIGPWHLAPIIYHRQVRLH